MSAENILASYKALAETGITDVVSDADVTRCTLVDAMTGRVVNSLSGNACEKLAADAETGVYIMVIEKGKSFETYKFVKK